MAKRERTNCGNVEYTNKKIKKHRDTIYEWLQIDNINIKYFNEGLPLQKKKNTKATLDISTDLFENFSDFLGFPWELAQDCRVVNFHVLMFFCVFVIPRYV